MDSSTDELCLLLTLMHRTIREMVVLFNLVLSIMLLIWDMDNNGSTSVVPRQFQRSWLQIEHLHRLIGESDITCISQLRMDRHTVVVLCNMVRDVGGLSPTRNLSVEEMMTMFLSILGHDDKN